MTIKISAAIVIFAALLWGCGEVAPSSDTAELQEAVVGAPTQSTSATTGASSTGDLATVTPASTQKHPLPGTSAPRVADSATSTPASASSTDGSSAPSVTNPLLSRTVRIWALGDSMTGGYEDNPSGYRSYRGTLFMMLQAAGYQIDFVGTRSLMPAVGGDPDNDGYPGAFIGPDGDTNNLDDKLNTLLPAINADIIILAFGWNSVFHESSSVVPIKYRNLVTRIAVAKPNAHLVVATLSPYKGLTEAQTSAQLSSYSALNDMARTLGHASESDKIHLADLASGGFVSGDYWDVIHWLQPGADRAARVIFDTLINGPLKR